MDDTFKAPSLVRIATEQIAKLCENLARPKVKKEAWFLLNGMLTLSVIAVADNPPSGGEGDDSESDIWKSNLWHRDSDIATNPEDQSRLVRLPVKDTNTIYKDKDKDNPQGQLWNGNCLETRALKLCGYLLTRRYCRHPFC